MGSNSTKREVTQEELAEAQNLWLKFTKGTKYGIIMVIAIVVLLALFLL